MGGYRVLLAVAAVGLFFTNVSNYTERYGLIPLAWIGLFGGLCVPVAASAVFGGRFTVPPLAWWGGGYVLVSVLGFYRSPQDAFAYEEVQMRVLSVLFLALALVAFADGRARLAGRRAVAAATVLAVGVNVYELFNPQAFSTVLGRSAGLYGNPNQSAAALVLGLILGHGVVPARWRGAFVAATAVGIVPTFSRSGVLAWLLVVAFFTLRAGFGVAQVRRVVVLAAAVVGLLVSPAWGWLEAELEEQGTLTENVLARIGLTTDDASSEERAGVAAAAWALVGEEPLRGHGTGASLRIEGFAVGTHNVYLAMMVDHGFPVGVLVVPLLLAAGLWGAGRGTLDLWVPFAAFVALWGMFSHNVLEERYILVAVGCVAGVVAGARGEAVSGKGKAGRGWSSVGAVAEPSPPAPLPLGEGGALAPRGVRA